MENPFELICQKLDAIIALQTKMVKLMEQQTENAHPSFPDSRPRMRLTAFCKEYQISRVTAHAWAHKKIIVTEKVGNCVYVLTDSIAVNGSMIDYDQRISRFKKKF
jgi:hypothetical protein